MVIILICCRSDILQKRRIRKKVRKVRGGIDRKFLVDEKRSKLLNFLCLVDASSFVSWNKVFYFFFLFLLCLVRSQNINEDLDFARFLGNSWPTEFYILRHYITF